VDEASDLVIPALPAPRFAAPPGRTAEIGVSLWEPGRDARAIITKERNSVVGAIDNFAALGLVPGRPTPVGRPPVSEGARPTAPGRDAERNGVFVSFSEEARAAAAETSQDPTELTDEERQEVRELQQRDREVRQHEQAHVAAAGRYANGGPQYAFTTGPDGRRYATSGEVSIDTSPARTPEATIQKAQVIRRAALAPAEPSAQDRRVAAEASQLEASARRELREAQRNPEGDPGQPSVGPAAIGGVRTLNILA